MPSSPHAGDRRRRRRPPDDALGAHQVLHGAARRLDPRTSTPQEIRPVAEVEADIARSNDKERAIGLVAAPVAAIIGLIISSASINYAKTHNET